MLLSDQQPINTAYHTPNNFKSDHVIDKIDYDSVTDKFINTTNIYYHQLHRTNVTLATVCNTNNVRIADGDPYQLTDQCLLYDFAIFTISMGSFSLLGLVGNAVSFAVLSRDRKSKSVTSFLLRSLAVTDILVLLAALPLFVFPAACHYLDKTAGFFALFLDLVPILWGVYQVPYTATIYVTVLVSMHRYFTVCKPSMTSNEVTNRFKKMFRGPYTLPQARNRMVMIAIFALVYNIPRFFEYAPVYVCSSLEDTTPRKAFDMTALSNNRLYRLLYSNIMYFVLVHGGPLLMIAYFNVCLIGALKRRQRRRIEMGKGWCQQDVSLVLVAVMCVFIVCQTPTFIDHVILTWSGKEERLCGHWIYYYTAFADFMSLVNSSVNFVVYIITSRNFRHGLMLFDFVSNRSQVAVLQQQHQQQNTLLTFSNNNNKASYTTCKHDRRLTQM
ncbi:hypothetical protein HELRODRAFT_174986 [Helobdella robusta]|uniref:G-protein coupled receptors family 1 profile domain-containing protein n=1 Tax=Helobdella robusta TaxID=6412 RepID=T1F8P4_HELRO|nr:hypothetical protein HELRODRAFT_174986 [Helobdella robusta]ESO01427.1 hypothetical protein HELRODRAFT_174986 [Helobdella robusta]